MLGLNEVITNSSIEQWGYIPGSEDIGDICTRTNLFKNLYALFTWKKRPKFIYDSNRKQYKIGCKQIVNALEITTNEIVLKHYTFCIRRDIYSKFYKLVTLSLGEEGGL